MTNHKIYHSFYHTNSEVYVLLADHIYFYMRNSCWGPVLEGVIVVSGEQVGIGVVENKATQIQGMDAKF